MGGYASKLKAAQEANAAAGSLVGKHAVVFGGTNGIGRAIAERLATGGASVVIVGRNEEAGKQFLATMEELEAKARADAEGAADTADGGAAAAARADEAKGKSLARHRFLQADLMSLDKCKAVASQLLDGGAEAIPRLDYLVFCQTKATTQGLTKTADGFDEKLAMHIWTRAFLSEAFAPLLRRTAGMPDADVRVLWVLSAGIHAPYAKFREDPRLEDNYSLKNAADIAGFYTDLYLDKKAREMPEVTWVHAAPGFVKTNWGSDLNAPMRAATRCIQAIGGRPANECADFLCQSLLVPARRGGLRLIGQYGEDAEKTKLHSEEAADFVADDIRSGLQKWLEQVPGLDPSIAQRTAANKKE